MQCVTVMVVVIVIVIVIVMVMVMIMIISIVIVTIIIIVIVVSQFSSVSSIHFSVIRPVIVIVIVMVILIVAPAVGATRAGVSSGVPPPSHGHVNKSCEQSPLMIANALNTASIASWRVLWRSCPIEWACE